MENDKKPKGLGSQISSPSKYDSNSPVPGQPIDVNQAAKEFEKLKEKLESFKKDLIKKFKFTVALGILPAPSFKLFEEDENLAKEVVDSKPLHLVWIIPEDEYKNIPKIKPEMIKLSQETKENIWVHIKTPIDLWNYGLDSKFEFIDAISASYPLHDNGFLGNLRLANIHKSLVLRKFEKYVATYAIGGSLVRGTAGKDSDVDTFVIIDDTDVKRMSRLELLEELRGIIYDYIREANALAGVKNVLNVQVYLLTDFWQNVKDAHPVMFTFIRDGVPFYDRGTFIPWKLLLQMGKTKPSPEAVDMFMKSGDQTDALIKRRLIDGMIDIYWGIVTPTQALMMLAGSAPPEPKIIVQEVKKLFVEKEKLMGTKELKTLERIVGLYKDYEHGKLTEISGKEIDELKKESDEYVKKMKELRKQIEVRMREHGVNYIYEEVFKLLKNLFGNKSPEALVIDLEKELVKKGKLKPKMLEIAKEIADVKKKAKSDKFTQNDMQRINRDASDLIGALIEYSQRKDLVALEKSVMQVSYKDKKADIVLTDSGIFVAGVDGIKKISGNKLVETSREELEKALASTKDRLKVKLSSKDLDVLRKELGDFEINF